MTDEIDNAIRNFSLAVGAFNAYYDAITGRYRKPSVIDVTAQTVVGVFGGIKLLSEWTGAISSATRLSEESIAECPDQETPDCP